MHKSSLRGCLDQALILYMGMKRYDYYNGDKTILISGPKGTSLRRRSGFANTAILLKFGEKGWLKGKAYEDYLKMKKCQIQYK